MIKYEIFTEDKNRARIESIVSSFFSGFTILESTGYWCGVSEKSLCVVIMSDDRKPLAIQTICEGIKTVNKQDAILLTISEITGVLV